VLLCRHFVVIIVPAHTCYHMVSHVPAESLAQLSPQLRRSLALHCYGPSIAAVPFFRPYRPRAAGGSAGLRKLPSPGTPLDCLGLEEEGRAFAEQVGTQYPGTESSHASMRLIVPL
jgi:hypothetical protein